MRNPAKEAGLSKLLNVTLLQLDVSNPAEIQSVVAKFTSNSTVDAVFNNAGYALTEPLES